MTGSLWSDEQEKPVRHLRVVDLTVMLPGPYLTRILSQYGADVVKVEALPEGDPLRTLSNTALYDLMNQGKKSVGLNLKTAEGVQIVKQLASESDVFVENFKDGVLDQLGLGYSDLSEENPDLLYVSLRGLSGKHAALPGHDLNFIAQSGCGEWFLESGTPNYSAHFGDVVGGTLMPAIKLLMHLANPARQGMHLVSYMDEGFRSLFIPRAFDHYRAEECDMPDKEKFGLHQFMDGSEPHTRYYKCRDGQWLSLSAIQAKHWETFCEVVDRAAWKERAKDVTLIPEVEKLFLDAPASYWEALSANREMCLFRVVPWGEFYSFSQTRAQLAADPLTWAGFAPNPDLAAVAELGKDTFSVLHGLGISNKQLADWSKSGVVHLASPLTEVK